MMMQIYADVLGRPIRIGGSTQAGALGSAMYGAVAGGLYPDIHAAAEKMARPAVKTYVPDAENHAIYSGLYAEYKKLAEGEQKVVFGGRLGEYKYYDMDAVIASALELVKKEL